LLPWLRLSRVRRIAFWAIRAAQIYDEVSY
jgi:hypothetical protein